MGHKLMVMNMVMNMTGERSTPEADCPKLQKEGGGRKADRSARGKHIAEDIVNNRRWRNLRPEE